MERKDLASILFSLDYLRFFGKSYDAKLHLPISEQIEILKNCFDELHSKPIVPDLKSSLLSIEKKIQLQNTEDSQKQTKALSEEAFPLVFSTTILLLYTSAKEFGFPILPADLIRLIRKNLIPFQKGLEAFLDPKIQ